jgi:beta-lactamase class A
MKIADINGLENTVVEREATEQEIAQRETDATQKALRETAEKAKQASDATAKAALLDRLGITADEAALLLA